MKVERGNGLAKEACKVAVQLSSRNFITLWSNRRWRAARRELNDEGISRSNFWPWQASRRSIRFSE